MSTDQEIYNNDPGPYKPSDAEWNRASEALNKYVGDNGGGNINWDSARKTFEQNAASGKGNFGDWVNQTYSAKDSWVTPQAAGGANAGGYQPPPSPTSSWNREGFRDASQARPVGMSAADFIAQNGGISSGVRLVPGSQDKVILPTGEVIDLSINSNAQGQGTANGWTNAGQWNGSAAVPYADAGSGSGTGAPGVPGGASTATATLTAQQQQDQTLRQQLIDQLTQRSQQSLAVNPNDPVIRAQTDAFSADQTRVKRNYLADVAEKNGPLANMTGETRMANEREGQATSGFQADLQARELTARRQEIATALQQMGSMLTAEQQQQLTLQLAQMDDAIKRLGLQQSSEQFGQNLGFQYANLGQQGTLANNQLGLQYDQFDWDRSPLNPKNMLPASAPA